MRKRLKKKKEKDPINYGQLSKRERRRILKRWEYFKQRMKDNIAKLKNK